MNPPNNPPANEPTAEQRQTARSLTLKLTNDQNDWVGYDWAEYVLAGFLAAHDRAIVEEATAAANERASSAISTLGIEGITSRSLRGQLAASRDEVARLREAVAAWTHKIEKENRACDDEIHSNWPTVSPFQLSELRAAVVEAVTPASADVKGAT